jgi:hypothetical protein
MAVHGCSTAPRNARTAAPMEPMCGALSKVEQVL